MKIFLDTEFLNRGAGNPIDLISIGMVREDGEEFYAINVDAPLGAMVRDAWIRANVWPTLPLIPAAEVGATGVIDWDHEHPDIQYVKKLENLREDTYQFLVAEGEPELWGSFSGFDYVVLSQLSGTFSDHRPGVPMFINDIQQELNTYHDGKLNRALPPREDVAHHALNDAKRVKTILEWLRRQPRKLKVTG